MKTFRFIALFLLKSNLVFSQNTQEFNRSFETNDGVYGYVLIKTRPTTVGEAYITIQQNSLVISGIKFNGKNYAANQLESVGFVFPKTSTNCYFKARGSVSIIYQNQNIGRSDFSTISSIHYGGMGKVDESIAFDQSVKDRHNDIRKKTGIGVWEQNGKVDNIEIFDIQGSDINNIVFAARDFERKKLEKDEQTKRDLEKQKEEQSKHVIEKQKEDLEKANIGESGKMNSLTYTKANNSTSGDQKSNDVTNSYLKEFEKNKANAKADYEKHESDFNQKINTIDNPIEKGAYQFSYGVGEAIANKQVNTTLIEGTANMLFGFFDYLAKLRQEDLHFTGFKSKKYGCCTTYTGDFIDGKREGEGTLESSTMFYKGTFKNDKFEGNGSLKLFKVKQRNSSLTTDQVYEGYFKNGSLYNGTLNAFNGISVNVINGMEDTSVANLKINNPIFFRKAENINWKKPDGKINGMDTWILNLKSKDNAEFAYLDPKDGTKGIFHRLNNELIGKIIHTDGRVLKCKQIIDENGQTRIEGEYEYIFPTGDKYIGVKESNKRVGKQVYDFINGDRLFAIVDQSGYVDLKNLTYKTKNGVASVGDIDKLILDLNQEKQVMYNLSFILFHSILSKKEDIKEYEVPEELKNQIISIVSQGKNSSILGLLKYEFPNIKWK